MFAANISPSNFTLGILVKKYGKRRQLDKAFETIEAMSQQFHLKLNTQVRTALLCVCVNNKALDKAMAVLEEMKGAGGVEARAYNTLISGPCGAGRSSEQSAC